MENITVNIFEKIINTIEKIDSSFDNSLLEDELLNDFKESIENIVDVFDGFNTGVEHILKFDDELLKLGVDPSYSEGVFLLRYNCLALRNIFLKLYIVLLKLDEEYMSRKNRIFVQEERDYENQVFTRLEYELSLEMNNFLKKVKNHTERDK